MCTEILSPDVGPLRRRPECLAVEWDDRTAFNGDALIVELQHDKIISHAVLKNYRIAFQGARLRTYQGIEGALITLSEERWQQAYTSVLLNWATEKVLLRDG